MASNPMQQQDAHSVEAELVERIKRLQQDRQRHADAIAAIDEVLSRVTSALGGHAGETSNLNVNSSTADSSVRRRRGRFTQTAEQSVFSFIQRQGNPSTADINAHWRAEGRKGTANVTLLKLLNQKLIRRQPDPNVRGSRYVAREAQGQEQLLSSRSE